MQQPGLVGSAGTLYKSTSQGKQFQELILLCYRKSKVLLVFIMSMKTYFYKTLNTTAYTIHGLLPH